MRRKPSALYVRIIYWSVYRDYNLQVAGYQSRKFTLACQSVKRSEKVSQTLRPPSEGDRTVVRSCWMWMLVKVDSPGV